MNNCRTLICIFFFCQFCWSGSAQLKNIEELKALLTLKLCEKVVWPADTQKLYHLGIISDNNKLIEQFKKFDGYNQQILKYFRIIVIQTPDNLEDVDILYFDQKNLELIKKLSNLPNYRKKLIFTENETLNKEFMFNILTYSNNTKATFELNRANLIFSGFDVLPEIIELKGNEVDVRDLYKQTKKLLLLEEDKVKGMQLRLDSQRNEIEKLTFKIESLNNDIFSKNVIIEHQVDSIRRKEKILLELKKTTVAQESVIQNNLSSITKQRRYIILIDSMIKKQGQNIEKQQNNLANLNKQIKEREKDLAHKDFTLKEKDILIHVKNNQIYLLAALTTLIAVLVFLFLRAYRINKADKLVLAEQKEKLETALEHLTQTQELLVRSEKMVSLGVLTAGIAHEINNPINFVITGINSLQKDFEDIIIVLTEINKLQFDDNNLAEKIKHIEKLKEEYSYSLAFEGIYETIDDIRLGANRTAEIVKGLRNFSRLDNDERSLYNIHEGIDAALLLLRNKYKSYIEIVKKYDENLPYIECFSGKLNQVFMNIISNAIDAIDSTVNGKIIITTQKFDDKVSISIKDNGHGMTQEIKSRIFDPFYTTKKVGKGTGLGLAITYGIIEEHKGNIAVISEPEKGTEFLISLPIN
jgi:signal transduction histidine kinase